MQLSDELVSQFVKHTMDPNGRQVETTAYGTVVVHGESSYVQIDGSDILTPIVSTTEVNDGDRVIVRLKNHTAMVTGNVSDPAIGVKRANGMESRITQTAEEIRLEVANEVADLEASITLTSEEIRSEVTDVANNLESRITQNSTEITSIVKNQEGFSEFQQTVEGFSFMDKGGTVKIGGGDINLTGCIRFGDLDDEVSDEIENATSTANSAMSTASTASGTANDALLTANGASDTANTALAVAGEANNLANSANYNAGMAFINSSSAQKAAEEAKTIAASIQLPSYLKSTYIDSTTIMSPVIVGGAFYAVTQDAWTQMTAEGLRIYTGGNNVPKIEMINYDTVVQLIIGSGWNSAVDPRIGRFYITKHTTYVEMIYYSSLQSDSSGSPLACGFRFNNNGTISVIGSVV